MEPATRPPLAPADLSPADRLIGRRCFLRRAVTGLAVGLAGPPLSTRATNPPSLGDPASGGSPLHLAREVLEIEGRSCPVTDALRRTLAETIEAGAAAVRGAPAAPVRSKDRSEALAILAAIDGALVRRGFLHPESGAVDGLPDCLAPLYLTAAARSSIEAPPENLRRLGMIAERFPGPFHAIDCDTACFLYLGVGESLGLPLRMVFLPSRNRRRSHAFIRWRIGRRAVDWETTEGRERRGSGTGRDASADAARGAFRSPEFELTRDNVRGCAHYLAGVRCERAGHWADAVQAFATAIELFPEHLDARRQFAWDTATIPTLPSRDLKAAVRHARYVVKLIPDADAHDTLAAAYAAIGRMDEAVKEETAALADPEAPAAARAGYHQRLELYRRGEPYRRRE